MTPDFLGGVAVPVKPDAPLLFQHTGVVVAGCVIEPGEIAFHESALPR